MLWDVHGSVGLRHQAEIVMLLSLRRCNGH